MTLTDIAPPPAAGSKHHPVTNDPVGGDRRIRELEEQVRDLARQLGNHRLIHDTWLVIMFVLVGLALVASLIAVGFGMRAIDEAEQATTTLRAWWLAPLP